MQVAAELALARKGEIPTIEEPQYKRRYGSTMKALAWFGTTDVRLIDAAIPDITEPDDVIVKVTEILALQEGDILGHEFMGKVDRIGSNVKNLKVRIACGKCKYCQQKLSSFCDNTNSSSLMNYMYGMRDAGFSGYSHFTGGFPGGQAEYVRVPLGEVNLLPVPAELPDEKVLFLSDVLPTSYHAVVDTGVEEGDTVGIWGLGPIVPERLALAEKGGFEVIDFTKDKDVTKKIKELVPDGLDVAIDCGTFHEPKTLLHKGMKMLMLETDVPEIVNEMIVSVKKMGRCGLTAVYAGFTNGFNIGALMEKGVRLIGNGQAPVQKYWKEILEDYIQTGKFDPRFMITHRVPIDDIAKLYAAFDKRIAGVEKVFVETQFSDPPSEGTPQTTRVDEWK
ncbi:GroES-like protein [Melanogaster broomeanus]|nr:GroES-like protein [Melanogaster broomeanus]